MPFRGSVTGFGYGRWESGNTYYQTIGRAQWAAYIDGAGDDINLALICDNNCNIYAAGITNPLQTGGSVVYDACGNTQSRSPYSIPNISRGLAGQVVKFNTNGKCQWVASFDNPIATGPSIQIWYSAACDKSNNIYLNGTTTEQAVLYDASGFTSVQSGINTLVGRSMPFCKINSNGKWQWATGLGGFGGGSEGTICAVDNNNDIYFSGWYLGGATNRITISNASGNGQVASSYSIPQVNGVVYSPLIKLNASGQVQWALYASNTTNVTNAGPGLATDTANNVYFGITYCNTPYNPIDASGFTQSNNTLFTLTRAGAARSAALIKYDSNGKVQWCTKVDTTSSNDSRAIVVDSKSNIYWMGMYGSNTGTYFVQDVSGTTQSNSLITLRQPISVGDSNLFLIKYTPDGKAIWATCFGQPNQSDYTWRMCTDSLDNIYITGIGIAGVKYDLYDVSGTTQVLSPFNFTPTAGRGNAGILIKYNSNGIAQWGTLLDALGNDYTMGVATDKTNSVYVTGGTVGVTNVYDVSRNGVTLSPITIGTASAANCNAPLVKYR